MKRSVQSAMRLGAEGIRVNCGGRLGGTEIARTEWYREGRVPLHTFRANVDYAESTAATTYGACGIKVWIYKGDMKKVEKGDFLKQRFKLSVAKNGPFAKILSSTKHRFHARIAFKRVFGQKTTQNGFIDRANRVWEIAQAELL